MNIQEVKEITKNLLKENKEINNKYRDINKNNVYSFIIDIKSFNNLLNNYDKYYDKYNLKTRNLKNNTVCNITIPIEIFSDYLCNFFIDYDYTYTSEYEVINMNPSIVNCNIKQNEDEYFIEFVYKDALQFDLKYVFNSIDYCCSLESLELV